LAEYNILYVVIEFARLSVCILQFSNWIWSCDYSSCIFYFYFSFERI